MNDRLRVGTRFGMVLVMLYYLGMSIEFLFFHPAIEATFGMKIPDPEMLRFFGVTLLTIPVLLLLALRSGSFLVGKPILEALVIGNLIVLGVDIYLYNMSHELPSSLYMAVGGGNVFVILMMLLALRMNDKRWRSEIRDQRMFSRV